MRDFNHFTSRVTHIKKPRGKKYTIVAPLRRLYLRYFKRYPLLRGLVNFTRQKIYNKVVPVIYFIYYRVMGRRYDLIKLSEFTKVRGIPTTKLADVVQVGTPMPEVFPDCDKSSLVSPHDYYSFPSVYVARISGGFIYGGTNFILTEDSVICHDLYDFERDYTSEEYHFRNLINPREGCVYWVKCDKASEHMPVAAAFVDASAPNYAHWLTEVLPRIALFCENEQFKNIPIVVNDELHKNVMESLFLIAGPDREIVMLPVGRTIQVDVLYLTSVAGYVPYGRRNNKLDGHSHGIFNPHAFESVRRQVAFYTEKLPEYLGPEKIYLRRNSGVRKVTNTDQVEKLLTAQGYAIVDPEKLTFLQQVQLFSHAKVVIGSTGASLANAIFLSPGTYLAVFMAKHNDMIYRYWLNMLSPLQVNISYVLGNITQNNVLGIHADFFIDSKNIDDLIKSWQIK